MEGNGSINVGISLFPWEECSVSGHKVLYRRPALSWQGRIPFYAETKVVNLDGLAMEQVKINPCNHMGRDNQREERLTIALQA